MARSRLAVLVLFSTGLAASASAHSPVYRCNVNGQTVLTDKPCATEPAAGVAAPSPSGPVNGQVSGARSIVEGMRHLQMTVVQTYNAKYFGTASGTKL